MSSLMGLGTRAMFANMATLQSIGNNIANANTKGYSRQETQLETAGGQYTGSGFFGQGVNVTTITRSYDRFLTTQAAAAASVASYDSTRVSQLQQLENVFMLGEKGLGHAAGQLLNSFVDVANNPSDASARQVVLTRAQELSARFTAAGEQLVALQDGVAMDITICGTQIRNNTAGAFGAAVFFTSNDQSNKGTLSIRDSKLFNNIPENEFWEWQPGISTNAETPEPVDSEISR